MDKSDQHKLPATPIYHYTSQKGLLGIVNSKAIWATNILYLNDAAELQYAINLMHEEVYNFKEVNSGLEKRFLYEIYRARLEVISYFPFSPTNIYVCSFSSEKDQLSQWRGYCPDGIGFNIGFDFASSLYAYVKKQGFDLYECIYSTEAQSEIIKDYFLKMVDTYRERKIQIDDDYDKRLVNIEYQELLTEAQIEYLKIAPRLKHPRFAEEREWRLISKPISIKHPQVKYREGKSMIIPYFELKLAKENEPLFIPEVKIGPTPNKDLSLGSLQGLLISNKVSGKNKLEEEMIPYVTFSDIPYRNW